MAKYQHNPFIENFCYQLVVQKMDVDEMEEAKIDEIAENLYTQFESLLGRKIVATLPEKQREICKKKIADFHLQKDSDNLDMVASIFGDQAVDAMEFNKLLKITLKELSEKFLDH